MRTTAFRGTPLWRFLPVLFLLTFLPAAVHATPTLTLMFGGDGVYPKRATINSQRWFRIQATWDYKLVDDGYGVGGKERAERVDELTLQEPPSSAKEALSFNAGFGGNLWDQNETKGVANNDQTAGELGKRTLTVGPFAGMRYDHLVGRVGSGEVLGALGLGPRSTHTVKWILKWSKYDPTDIDPGPDKRPRGYVSQTPIELTATYDSVPVNPGGGGWVSGGGDVGELVYWYSSDASGVPPLQVVPQDATSPNAGSSSMTYIFRCVLWNIVPNTRPLVSDQRNNLPTFRGCVASAMPSEGYEYCRFEAYAASILDGNPPNPGLIKLEKDGDYGNVDRNPYRDWGFGLGGGRKFDYSGSHKSNEQEGGEFESNLSPEMLLIIDKEYTRPYYMVVEKWTGKSNEVQYRYDLKPTDYMQMYNNILGFPWDLFGSDAWDMYAEKHRGSPAQNNYVALGPGPHTYQFLSTRDWDPPVDKITDYQTWQPAIGKTMRCIVAQPGNRITTVDMVTGGAAVAWTGVIAGPTTPETPDGFGYPYDSQSGNYPKVNPVVCGWPAAFKNLTAESIWPGPNASYPFNTTPSITAPYTGDPLGTEPWGDDIKPGTGGYSPPGRVTNEDTILPNWANAWQDTVTGYQPEDEYDPLKPAPFRGGKWTTETNFVFRCVYFQSDNVPPKTAQVYIRKTDAAGNPIGGWVAHSMAKVYPSQNDYTKGVQYYYQATSIALPGGGGAGDYQYYFSFNDGKFTAIYPNRPAKDTWMQWPNTGGSNADPGSIGVPGGNDANNRSFFWFRVNHKPTLTNQSQTPSTGNQGTDFVFNVTYTDQDGRVRDANHQGDKPYKSVLWIDLFGDQEGQMQVTGVNPATGVISYSLPAGATAYTDSIKDAYPGTTAKVHFETGAAAGQEYVLTANTGAGNTGTLTVADDPNNPLASAGVMAGDLLQVVAFYPCTMAQLDPGRTDYINGVPMTFSTARAGVKLDPGQHPYYFEFWDNWFYWVNWDQYFMVANTPPDGKLEGEMARLPSAKNTYFAGPIVVGNRAPVLSKFYHAPPQADTVAKTPTELIPNTLDYIRPLERNDYLASELNGKYLQFQTGLAKGHIYQITTSTPTTLTVAKRTGPGNLFTDRVVLGDTFRVFNGWSAAAGLSDAYHQDPASNFDGTPGTGFNLYVTYADQDNDLPVSIRLAVYDVPPPSPTTAPDGIYELTKVDPADNNYVDGAEYVTSSPVSLTPGQHWIMAQAFDGNAWAAGGTSANYWVGPQLDPTTAATGPNVIVNHPPNPPVSGFSPAQGVTVSTANPSLRWDPATDPDPGDSVVRYTVQLSRTGFTNDSYEYQYQTTSNSVTVTDDLADLTTWSWRVKSEDTLGAQSVWSEVQNFFIDLDAPQPVLSPPDGDDALMLTPQQGDLSTEFTYKIIYSNPLGTAPLSGVYAEIDGNLYPTPMTQGPETDFTTGVSYSITVRGDSSALGYGAHTFRFHSGAVSYPATSGDPAKGPWIGSPGTLDICNMSYVPVATREAGLKLYLQVIDADQNQQAGVAEQVAVELSVSGGGDQEVATLTETGLNTGVFRGSIDTLNAPGPSFDGILNVPVDSVGGLLVTATYTDPDFADAPVPEVVTATVTVVDTTAPDRPNPALIVTSTPQGTGLNLDWSAYVPPVDLDGYHVWMSTTPFTTAEGMTPVNTLEPGTTTDTISGLQSQTTYYVAVTAFDRVPNEDKGVTGKSVKTEDNIGPEITDLTPADGATEVGFTPTISFRASDPSNVNLNSIVVKVNGVQVPAEDLTLNPSTGTPLTVTVTFSRTFTWNAVPTISATVRDTVGNPTTKTWSFEVRKDTDPPQVTDLNPEQGAGNVSPTAPISFHLQDPVSGVQESSIKLYRGTSLLTDITVDASNPQDVVVTWTPPSSGLPPSAALNFTIEASDNAGNAMSFLWRFTTLNAISGTITQNGVGKAGVTVTNGVVSAITDANGFYSLLGVANGTYTVVPSLQHFVFTPASRSVTVSDASVTGVNFTCAPATFSVSGTVADWGGTGVAGVTISNGTKTTTTDAAGRFVLDGLTVGSHTITASLSGWSFVPASATVEIPTTTSLAFTAYQAFSVNLPAGTSLIGMPFDPPNRDPVAVFGTSLVRRWDSTKVPPRYLAPGDADSQGLLEVRPGRGFFVRYGSGHTINASGVPVDTSAPYVIVLQQDWNMIGNPFLAPLPFNNLSPAIAGGVTNYAFTYDNTTGSYLFVTGMPGVNVARAHLLPWEGAWIRSLIGPTSLSATPPVGALQEAAQPRALDVGEGYVIPIVAKTAQRADLCSALGVSSQGAYKIENPPTVSGSVDLYFVDADGTRLAQLVKPMGVATQSWDFVVATDLPNAQVAISLPDLSAVPNNLIVTLEDKDTGRSLYMRTLPQYLFSTGTQGAVRHFTLKIGPRSASNLVISAAAAQATANGVVVTYSVSQACQVKIEVLNLAGRVVRRLASDQVVATGTNAQVWNLRNDQGVLAPAGRYLVRVEAMADNGQCVQAITPLDLTR